LYKILYKKGDFMKHGDIVRSVEGCMIGKVINTETECCIKSLVTDENRWIVRASNLKQFEKNWRVINTDNE
jgi:hypothetical protein